MGDPGERVASGGPRPLAGVEDGELHRPGIVEQGAEAGARDAVRRAVVALEHEHALLRLLVETAVADEVEHVEVVEQGALQPRQGGVLEDRDLETAARDEVAGRRHEQLALALDRQLGHVARARDHDEDPQRRLHLDDRGRSSESSRRTTGVSWERVRKRPRVES